MPRSLNELEAEIAALQRNSASSEQSTSEYSSSVEQNSSEYSSSEHSSGSSDSETGSESSPEDYREEGSDFSGYSCDSTDTESSEGSEAESELAAKRRAEIDQKANSMVRKKQKRGLSTICFKFLLGKCHLSDCIYHHATLDSLTEEERGSLVHELHKRPFDPSLGNLVKQLNIPVCKSFSKTGECKFSQKCKFWHIDTENDAKWAGYSIWCPQCRKAFTSEVQMREHEKGKFHQSNIKRI
jgi:hypothetical protein